MLIILGTPIGNLGDLSLRAAQELAQAEIILAEDTRSVQALFTAVSQYGLTPISHKIISYYKDQELEKLPFIMNLLREDKRVVLISESGMPVISDPGSLLLKAIARESIPFSVIPGPSAVTTSAVATGNTTFLFLGFFPKQRREQKKIISKIQSVHELFSSVSFIFFESPHRIKDTLTLFSEIVPSSHITICRELTKIHEEYVTGTPDELKTKEYRGEITVVITLKTI